MRYKFGHEAGIHCANEAFFFFIKIKDCSLEVGNIQARILYITDNSSAIRPSSVTL